MDSERRYFWQSAVALLAEGVDRNVLMALVATGALVALLAEGVDRNIQSEDTELTRLVALLAEGVDRNHSGGVFYTMLMSRPPRGGRG